MALFYIISTNKKSAVVSKPGGGTRYNLFQIFCFLLRCGRDGTRHNLFQICLPALLSSLVDVKSEGTPGGASQGTFFSVSPREASPGVPVFSHQTSSTCPYSHVSPPGSLSTLSCPPGSSSVRAIGAPASFAAAIPAAEVPLAQECSQTAVPLPGM